MPVPSDASRQALSRFKVESMRIKSFVLWLLAFILAAFLMHLFIDEMQSPVVSGHDVGFAGSARVSVQ